MSLHPEDASQMCGRVKNVKLFETRKASLEPQEEVAEFRDTVCLGNLSHRKVSLLRRF